MEYDWNVVIAAIISCQWVNGYKCTILLAQNDNRIQQIGISSYGKYNECN